MIFNGLLLHTIYDDIESVVFSESFEGDLNSVETAAKQRFVTNPKFYFFYAEYTWSR